MKKTQKLIAGISSIALLASATACSSSMPKKPEDKSCNDWKYQKEEGVYSCNQSSSSHYGHYYYGGTYYSSSSKLKKSSSYKSYKSSSSFKGTSSSGSSGFGKGTVSSGG